MLMMYPIRKVGNILFITVLTGGLDIDRFL